MTTLEEVVSKICVSDFPLRLWLEAEGQTLTIVTLAGEEINTEIPAELDEAQIESRIWELVQEVVLRILDGKGSLPGRSFLTGETVQELPLFPL